MPTLRVMTWNSGGESGRGQHLADAATECDQHFGNLGETGVQLVVIQEASRGEGDVNKALQNLPPFAHRFVAKPLQLPECEPGQQYRVAHNAAYLLSWLEAAPTGLTATGPALAHVNLASDPNVFAYIQGHQNRDVKAGLMTAASGMRWPVYKTFRPPGAPGTIHLISWHAPLKQQFRAANQIHPAEFSDGSPALPEAFVLLQESQFFQQLRQRLTAADVIVIAGDLNVRTGALALPWMFPGFSGYNRNLSSILAFSPSSAFAVGQGWDYVGANNQPDFRPHTIVTAQVVW